MSNTLDPSILFPDELDEAVARGLLSPEDVQTELIRRRTASPLQQALATAHFMEQRCQEIKTE